MTIAEEIATPRATAPRIRSIQEFRAIASLMVVAGHITFACHKYCGVWNKGMYALGVSGALGVDFFFIVSGLVIYQVAFRKLGGWTNAAQFLYRRATRVYPIYWFYTTLALVVYLAAPGIISHGTLTNASILPSYLLNSMSHGLLIGQAWTLRYELMFYMAFAAFMVFTNRKSLTWVLALWGIIILAVDLATHGVTGQNWLALSPLVLEFLLGCLAAGLLHRELIGLRRSVALTTVGVLGTVATGIWAVVSGRTAEQLLLLMDIRVLTFGLPFACMVLGVLGLERADRLRRRPWMEAIGDWSYSIYLLHILLINAVFRLGVGLAPRLATAGGAVVLAAASVVAVLLFGWASYRFLEKPLLQATGRMADWVW